MSKSIFLRDIAIQFFAAGSVLILWRFFLDDIPSRWQAVVGFGGLLFANAFIKFVMPRHVVLGPASWSYLLIVTVIILTGAFLMGDWGVLGLWTLPSLLGLGLLYWLVHSKLGPRYADDDSAQER